MHKTMATEAGEVMSNVDELYRLSLGLESPRSYVSAPSTDPAAAPATIDYAKGWQSDMFRGSTRFAAYGTADGKRNAFVRFPGKHATIIVLTNDASTDARAIAERIAGQLFSSK